MIICDELKKTSYWSFLSENEKTLLLQGAISKKYNKDNYIYGMNDVCLGMVYVCKGSIRVYMTSLEGREVTLFHIKEGECCIMSASCAIANVTLDVELLAEDNTEIIAVHSGSIKKLIDSNIYFKSYVYELVTKRFSSVVNVLQEIIFDKFDTRLAKFLLSIYEKTRNAVIRMTQETIAIEINTAREVVARMLKKFASDNLIELKRGIIILKDIDNLKKISKQ